MYLKVELFKNGMEDTNILNRITQANKAYFTVLLGYVFQLRNTDS